MSRSSKDVCGSYRFVSEKRLCDRRLQHVGKGSQGSFVRTYRVTWPVSEIIDDALAAQNLQALIVVTPGQNSNPEEVAANRLRRLPGYVYEWANFDPGLDLKTPKVAGQREGATARGVPPRA